MNNQCSSGRCSCSLNNDNYSYNYNYGRMNLCSCNSGQYFQSPYSYQLPYQRGNERIGPGGFILPFALGCATAPLVLRPRPMYYNFNPHPYPYPYPYY